MITDNHLVLSGTNTPGSAITGQAITGDAVSTNTIDLGTARDLGAGECLYVVFTVVAAFNTLTSLDLEVVGSTSADLSSHVVLSETNRSLGSLTAGAQFVVTIPPNIGSLGYRYLGVRYDVNGSNPTTGSILAQVVTDIEDGRKYYASGFAVS